MVDWSEIEALQNELEEVQQESTSTRLSERNCVELIMKLKELNMIQIIHSTNGKFYLTPAKLESEIISSIDDFGGRASIADIATDLGIDFTIVERTADSILDKCNLIKLQGQMLTLLYLKNLAAQINTSLQTKGFVAIGEIARGHDLPSDFVIEKLNPYLDAQMNSQKTGVYTSSFLRRLEARLKGFLTAALKPVKVSSFYQKNQIDETIFNQIFSKLTNSGRIKGSLVGRGSSATFIPHAYIEQQTREIKEKIESQGTVTVGELKKSMDLKKDSEAASFMSECFPHFTKLKTIFVSTTFMSKFNQDLIQDIENEKLIDLYSYLPMNFTDADLDLMLNNVDIGSCKKLSSDWLVTTSGLSYAKGLYSELIASRAEKAATRKVTIITEDSHLESNKSNRKEPEKEKGGGGGRGAREIKTKGKDKKRKKKEAQEAAEETKNPEGALQEEEIDSVLQEDSNFESLDDDSRQAMVDLLLPVLSAEYQERATSIFASKQESTRQTKKSRREEEESINICYTKLMLFNKTLQTIEGADAKDVTNMEKYLQKTVGMDLVNMIFALSSDSTEKNLTQPMRAGIISKMSSDEAKDALVKLERSKTPSEILDSAYDAAEFGAEMMIKYDKKREKAIMTEHLAGQAANLQGLTEFPVTLHMGTTVVFSHIFNSPIHYPGKMTETIINLLETKLPKDQYDTLKDAQADLVKFLSKEEVDVDAHIDKIKKLCDSIQKVQ